MEGQAEGAGLAGRQSHGRVTDQLARGLESASPRVYEKFPGDHPADSPNFRNAHDHYVERVQLVAKQEVRDARHIQSVRAMTPEQLCFWLRGLAAAGPVARDQAGDLLSVIFNAALNSQVEPLAPPVRSPCGCGGHR